MQTGLTHRDRKKQCVLSFSYLPVLNWTYMCNGLTDRTVHASVCENKCWPCTRVMDVYAQSRSLLRHSTCNSAMHRCSPVRKCRHDSWESGLIARMVVSVDCRPSLRVGREVVMWSSFARQKHPLRRWEMFHGNCLSRRRPHTCHVVRRNRSPPRPVAWRDRPRNRMTWNYSA